MQIHIDVDPAFWRNLHKATKNWPERQRSQASISRYALKEIYCEIMEYGMDSIKASPAFGTGQHVQVKSHPEDEEVWLDLIARFGSSAKALKIALAFLLESLESYSDVSE